MEPHGPVDVAAVNDDEDPVGDGGPGRDLSSTVVTNHIGRD